MITWIKLTELDDVLIPRGAILRYPAKWPYEEMVEFMLVRMIMDHSDHSLIVATGHKAGHVLVNLPLEAEWNRGDALDKLWVINNWAKWIYPECGVQDVLCKRRYEIV